MSGFRITNCHVHCFTARHVPSLFPHPLAWPFIKIPGLVRGLAFLCRLIGQHPLATTLDRLYRFQQETSETRQERILAKLVPQYPSGTRFVLLPMDLRATGGGRIAADLTSQHDELAELAASPAYAGRALPFATLDPRQPGAVAEARRAIEQLGFRGLKLYPRLGYPPDHEALMRDLYPLLVERNLPVMTHCSRGGVSGRGISTARGDRYCAPGAFIPMLREFPTLRVCLAHFGGEADWRDYVENGTPPDTPVDPTDPAGNWQVAIRHMITCGEFPGVWTDISYTLFHFEDYAPFLKVFLEDEKIAARVLFGSDYYMTRQEALSERAVCFRLRVMLGEAAFRRIAETNPEIWLGERPEAA
jgi:predicted TIM-barrel fold metal-dependent hydrolase